MSVCINKLATRRPPFILVCIANAASMNVVFNEEKRYRRPQQRHSTFVRAILKSGLARTSGQAHLVLLIVAIFCFVGAFFIYQKTLAPQPSEYDQGAYTPPASL